MRPTIMPGCSGSWRELQRELCLAGDRREGNSRLHLRIVRFDTNLSSFQEAAGKIISIQIPGVSIIECQRMAGEWCMLLKVRVTSPEVFTLLLDEILRIADIKETSTTFILSIPHPAATQAALDIQPQQQSLH